VTELEFFDELTEMGFKVERTDHENQWALDGPEELKGGLPVSVYNAFFSDDGFAMANLSPTEYLQIMKQRKGAHERTRGEGD
jgi:hypothetical protein